MNAATETTPAPAPLSKEAAETARAQRVARARQAYREHYGYGYWSTHLNMEITEENIPFIIDGLRRNGGHKEWYEAQTLVALRSPTSCAKPL